MGPWTRAFRMVFSAALGALAGFVLWMMTSSVTWYRVAQANGLSHPMFEDLVLLAFMGAGALVGLLIGRRGMKRTIDGSDA